MFLFPYLDPCYPDPGYLDRANATAIKRSMTSFPWLQHFSNDTDPNWQVKTFTKNFLNMSNFIPNETKRFLPRDPPWITKSLKTMLNRKNRLFKNYKSHRYTRRLQPAHLVSCIIRGGTANINFVHGNRA